MMLSAVKYTHETGKPVSSTKYETVQMISSTAKQIKFTNLRMDRVSLIPFHK